METVVHCSESDCSDRICARGLCRRHYAKRQRQGTLPEVPGLVQFRTAVERYEYWTDRSDPDGCWLWTGALTSGYGYMVVSTNKRGLVHRWAYEHFVGPIPEGLDVGHRCHDLDLSCRGGECIHRRCSRPDHLLPMTRGENTRAGRLFQLKTEAAQLRRSQRTVCKNGHEWNEANVYVSPSGYCMCRKCVQESKRRRRREAKAEEIFKA